VAVTVVSDVKKDGYETWKIRFTNRGPRLAFFLNPQVIAGGEEVLPSYWSDNYFSIPAGETLGVTVSCPTAVLGGQQPQLRLEGWNIRSENIHL
jgi:hypothetical protein